MNIASILATKGDMAHTARPEQSIREALGLLAQHNVGALIVVNDAGRPVGILSERDVVREAASNERVFGMKVAEIMTRDVITGSPHDDLMTVAHTMTERSEEHTSELQSQSNLVCRLLLEKKKPLPLTELHHIRLITTTENILPITFTCPRGALNNRVSRHIEIASISLTLTVLILFICCRR